MIRSIRCRASLLALVLAAAALILMLPDRVAEAIDLPCPAERPTCDIGLPLPNPLPPPDTTSCQDCLDACQANYQGCIAAGVAPLTCARLTSRCTLACDCDS